LKVGVRQTNQIIRVRHWDGHEAWVSLEKALTREMMWSFFSFRTAVLIVPRLGQTAYNEHDQEAKSRTVASPKVHQLQNKQSLALNPSAFFSVPAFGAVEQELVARATRSKNSGARPEVTT
jgi:hypothetical protein